MTHTITDAEAAIARHPESLETLSMAADLLQELDDPRGEDFAACLDGRMRAEELMRRHPADVSAMYVAAWAMGRVDEMCEACNGIGRVKTTGNGVTWNGGLDSMWAPRCVACDGMGQDNRDNAARAEGLRLLAECGKVGLDGYGYGWADSSADAHLEAKVCHDWAVASRIGDLLDTDIWDVVRNRIALINAYANADPDTRRQWAEETRALTPTAEVAQ